MAGISITDTYDALLSTTLRNYRKKLINQIFDPLRFLKWLMNRRGKGRAIGTFDLQDGGYSIIEHLLYGKNSTVKFYEQYETLDTTPQEGITVAEYDWREVGGTISISRKEQRQNSGEHAMINLLQAKISQAERTVRDKLAEKAVANVSAETAPDLTSVIALVNNSPSTNTVGGVAGATYTWWRNHQADIGAYATQLLSKMRIAVNTVGVEGNIDAILCSQGAFQYYEALADGNDRFDPVVRKEKKSLDLGFDILNFKGADMFFDFKLATGVPVTGDTMIGLNGDHIRLVMDKESNFVTTDFIEPENQTAKVAKVLAMCNLVTDNRRAHFMLHGIDAS